MSNLFSTTWQYFSSLLFTNGIPEEDPDYIVSIKSGNQHEIGSTSSIRLKFFNTDEKRSIDIEYDCKRGEKFKPGEVKSFRVYKMQNIGKLDKMELTQKNGEDWYVQWVEVMDYFTKDKFTFPVHRWMKAEKKVRQ